MWLATFVACSLVGASVAAPPPAHEAPVQALQGAAPASYPPGRIGRQEALRRVAVHACLTTLARAKLGSHLDGCVDNFAHEIIVDDSGECARLGVREDKLPFCQAAVSRWLQVENSGDKADTMVSLVKAYSRCSAATLCSAERPRLLQLSDGSEASSEPSSDGEDTGGETDDDDEDDDERGGEDVPRGEHADA